MERVDERRAAPEPGVDAAALAMTLRWTVLPTRMLRMSRAPADVSSVIGSYPSAARVGIRALRSLILQTAARTAGVGPLHETLKWGEPAYLTSVSGSGSTIRIAWKPSTPDQYAMLFNCKTTLIDTFRTHFPDTFVFDGNRAIVFHSGDEIPREALVSCIATALLYHTLPRGALAPHH